MGLITVSMVTSQNTEVRVRFAPSPTGHLHIGGLRAALFNWLFARHVGGKFLLRIEDTDLERSRPEYTESIISSLAWCGLEPDEPLMYQSQRRHEHLAIAQMLLDKGKAYRCYCTPEELEKRLGISAAEGGYVHYDGKCRNLAQGLDKPDLSAIDKSYVIRFKTPRDREVVVVNDLIRGSVSFSINTIDDFIIVRSDNSPMFNFVVVLDDAFMRVSHVIRGEEHLVNTPRHVLLFEACGYAIPQFAHIPLILGSDGTKLSKREGATAVTDYKNTGYLADALCNYLVRLGWSHGDQELFTRAEMVEFFTLNAVHKAGAIFDIAKLLWMNHVYLQQSTAQQLMAVITRDVDDQFLNRLKNWSDQMAHDIIDLYKNRVKTLIELRDEVVRIHQRPRLDHDAFIQQINPMQREALEFLIKHLAESDYVRPSLELLVKQICKQVNIKLPDLAQPIRFALTGSLSAPGIYDLLLSLGKEESLARLRALEACLP